MKKKSQPNKYFYASIIFALLNLVVVVYSKYKLNGLEVSEFNYAYFGNLANIFLTLFLVLGLFVQSINSADSKTSKSLVILIVSVIYFSTSVCFLIIGTNDFKFGSALILSYPPQKMIMGILAIGNILLQTYLAIFVWGMFIYKGNYLYVKSFTFLMFVSFFSVVLVSSYSSFLHKSNNSIASEQHYGYAVVLGAAVWKKDKPSPLFRGRIMTAKKLLEKKIVKKILLTGSNAPGENSEAVTAYKYLINQGVNKSLLVYEDKTNTTSEQIKFLRFGSIDNSKNNSYLIVSDNFHLVRVSEICKFFGINADTYSSNYIVSTKKQLYYSLRESIGLILFWFFAV